MTEQISTDRNLRLLLQMNRKRLGLTQAQAAILAGIDQSWWKKLESGRRLVVSADTAAMMCAAVGIQPDDIPEHPAVTERLRLLQTGAIVDLDLSQAEAHLAATPGTTPDERLELIRHLRSMRQPQYARDPYAERLRKLLRSAPEDE